jgi:hypothetical protein
MSRDSPIPKLSNEGSSAASATMLSERKEKVQPRHVTGDQSVVIPIHLAKASEQ